MFSHEYLLNYVRIEIIKIEKNKLAIPFKEANVDIYYGSGFCSTSNTLDEAVNLDLIEKSGAWFSYNGQRLGQGEYGTTKFLFENKELYKEIRDKVLTHYSMPIYNPDCYTDHCITSITDKEIVEDKTDTEEVIDD